ncbi:MAG: SBBP repeat-containing protein, partial [Parachlamydiaceae bacterium]|nr:SBBP repeat-containing protein [Parachlamydiaceae bacterium]
MQKSKIHFLKNLFIYFILILCSSRIIADEITKEKLNAQLYNLPLSFEKNIGQTHPVVEYLVRNNGLNLFFTKQDILISLKNSADEDWGIRMKFLESQSLTSVHGIDEQEHKSNYFIGQDCDKWHSNISNYNKICYKNIYKGIDLLFYGKGTELEYDINVFPGSDPRQIKFQIEGVKTIFVDDEGHLHLVIDESTELLMHKPYIYQMVEGKHQLINGSFQLLPNNQIGFEIAEYDHQKLLIIDPVLSYSTYLGGNGTAFLGGVLKVDSSGNVYVIGSTSGNTFPTTVGAYQTTLNGSLNAFVTKINPTGTALIYSTYLGGTGSATARGLTVDSSGNAYITGEVQLGFPVTGGAFQTTFAGIRDGFLTKLNSTGTSLIFSTYLGGTGDDAAYDVVIDNTNNPYVVGRTNSTNFPVTVGAFQTTRGGGFDVFITKFNTTGSGLVYSTYLGGSNDEGGNAIDLDASKNAYVTGETRSSNFPVTAGAFQITKSGGTGNDDSFVTKLNSTGTALIYSTYLGGTAGDTGEDIKVDSSNNAYVIGQTSS